jgi:hypothetical protein
LNFRPHPYQGCALPLSYGGKCCISGLLPSPIMHVRARSGKNMRGTVIDGCAKLVQSRSSDVRGSWLDPPPRNESAARLGQPDGGEISNAYEAPLSTEVPARVQAQPVPRRGTGGAP